MTLRSLVGEEVFITAASEEEDEGEIFVTTSLFGLLDHMGNLSASTDSETRVFHGVLSTAEVIPESFKNKSVFLVFINPNEVDRGYVAESGSGSPDELAVEIEGIIGQCDLLFNGDVSIDDMFILYGYQIEVCLCVKEDSIDEEAIYTCKKIYDEVEDILATTNDNETSCGGNNG
jgi:hypothetical protein